MSNIILHQTVKTMTSREIAELTGKSISSVHRDIRATLGAIAGIADGTNDGKSLDWEIDRKMMMQILDHHEIQGVTVDWDARGYATCFYLTKAITITLVSGYNVKMRLAIVKRWQDLEEQVAKPAFDPASLTRMDILKMAMESESKLIEATAMIEQKDAQLAIVAPKAEALDRISTFAEGALCLTNAAKVLQLQPKKFIAWMQEKRWIYRRPGGAGLVGYQSRIQVGYLEHKITTVERTDGTTKQVEQVLVTAKGLAKLATDFGAGELVLA